MPSRDYPHSIHSPVAFPRVWAFYGGVVVLLRQLRCGRVGKPAEFAMLHRQYTPPPVRSLLNHLDAALAACDDLLAAQGSAADPHDLLRLELTAIAHVLQAREDMQELRLADGAVRSQIALFLTVTGCLEETSPAGAAAGLEAAATLLIGGRIEVATLRALITAMRDIVELCFVTFNDAADPRHQLPPAITESVIWATSPECT
jgi:hypothetical protein